MGGEATRVEKRGETTRGETTRGEGLGGETSCYPFEYPKNMFKLMDKKKNHNFTLKIFAYWPYGYINLIPVV